MHSAYVFCNLQGQPYDELKQSFKTVCREVGITNFRFLELRHTCATCLVMHNVNLKTVQHLLGHKDIRMTLHNSYLSREHLQVAGETLDLSFEVGTKWEQATNL